MKAAAALTILSTALVGQVLGQASTSSPPVNDNPVGVAYQATLPKDPFFKGAAIDGNVKGYVWAVAGDGGKGVKYNVRFENLPKEGGPFMYHLHVAPAEGGNCTKTLAHLDPTARGEEPPCNPKAPETCQAGDLSGKYGMITSDPFQAEYIDLYSSTKEGIGAFFGNRSFVLHYANKTRLTCANFEHVASNGTSNGTRPSSTGSSPTMTPTWVNGAVANIVSFPLALAGVAAAVFAL